MKKQFTNVLAFINFLSFKNSPVGLLSACWSFSFHHFICKKPYREHARRQKNGAIV